ncbi:hypothetical protein BCR35DRAFT_333920 [Leucosporidium creatinivorum]|uniref:WD40-repeat-containing domain protein n=1 Tax=Leucosporidium creatinivorum TaxID=106004 RepID=A0A1Y2EMG6_9BASI|nr:hypothetical protein BCR35DRAFT_333920 [Leucosporidium creatinivorum]
MDSDNDATEVETRTALGAAPSSRSTGVGELARSLPLAKDPQVATIEVSDTSSSSSDDDLPTGELRNAQRDDEEDVVVTEGAELEAHNLAMAARREAKLAAVKESQRWKAATLKVDLNAVHPHFPLPKPPTQLLAHSRTHDAYFHPLEAHQRRMTDAEYSEEYRALNPLREKRRNEQRRRDGTDWSTRWSLEGYNTNAGGGDGAGAAFFPCPEYDGLAYLDGVFATVTGNLVELWQVKERKGATATSSVDDCYRPTGVLIAQSVIGKHEPSHKDGEDLYALAWSVNISTWPFTPLLAVGGKGRAIHIFTVKREGIQLGSVALVYDRTIVGHGGPIVDLKFSPSHPHLLVSASADRTARLFDPTVLRPSLPDEGRSDGKALKDKKSKKKAMAWHGEALGIFANDGHIKPLLSVDIHPRFPFVVTSGVDGKILLWRFPESLRGPTWPADGEDLYRHPPTASVPVPPPPLLDAPFFTSTSIHDGWCDQVLFASHSTAHIFSKAGRPATDALPVSGKEIKLWCPTILDRNAYTPGPQTPTFNDDDPSALAHLLNQRASSFPDGPDRNPISSAYRVYRRIDLDDENALQDRMGLHLLPLEAEDPSAILQTVLFVPTANEPSLYAFRPFGPLPTPTPAPEDRQLSFAEEREERLEALMATGEDRALYDMVPRLRPSAIMDVEAQKVAGGTKQPGKGGEMRLRCVAVQPNGAKWVVGVGDDGLLLIWRRRSEGEQ